MFKNLSDRLGQTLDRIRGQGRLTEDNIKETLREIRMALLEADVALPVVRDFIDSIREKATGENVLKSLTPGQTLVKIVNDELVHVMGDANERLDLSTQPPAVVLMAGLQGSGKTTFSAKLAHYLKNKKGRNPLLVAGDVYRPAAIEQQLKLRNPIYLETASYGHMGRTPQTLTKTFESQYWEKRVLEVELFTWEKLDYVDKVKAGFGLE